MGLRYSPTSFGPEMQNKSMILGMVIVIYCLVILFKSMLLYRREVVFSRYLLEAQSIAMLHQAKMSSLGEMAAGVAHEINNPLAVVMGYATQMVREVKTGKSSDERILFKGEKIIKTVERIAKIVNSLQTFSRNVDDDPFQESKLADIITDSMNFVTKNCECILSK